LSLRAELRSPSSGALQVGYTPFMRAKPHHCRCGSTVQVTRYEGRNTCSACRYVQENNRRERKRITRVARIVRAFPFLLIVASLFGCHGCAAPTAPTSDAPTCQDEGTRCDLDAGSCCAPYSCKLPTTATYLPPECMR
jgi:hypothetical protein